MIFHFIMTDHLYHIEIRYWIDFNKWEVFGNDDHSRTFLSLEVKTGGIAEVRQ